MERIRASLDGFKNLVSHAITYVAGADESDQMSYVSSCEEVSCKSDCSACDSENRPISLPSSKNSNVFVQNSKSRSSLQNSFQDEDKENNDAFMSNGGQSRKRLRHNHQNCSHDNGGENRMIDLSSDRKSVVSQLIQELNQNEVKRTSEEYILRDITNQKSQKAEAEPTLQRILYEKFGELSVFFGRKMTIDNLIPLSNSGFNKKDFMLRIECLKGIPQLGLRVGQQTLAKFLLITCTFNDSEEAVVNEMINTLNKLLEFGLLTKRDSLENLEKLLPFLLHPNTWIREGAMKFIKNLSDPKYKILSQAESYCIIRPKLKQQQGKALKQYILMKLKINLSCFVIQLKLSIKRQADHLQSLTRPSLPQLTNIGSQLLSSITPRSKMQSECEIFCESLYIQSSPPLPESSVPPTTPHP